MNAEGAPISGDRSAEQGIEPAPGVFVPSRTMRFTFSRSSGPGGQNVNKVNTRAELRIAVADIEGLSDPARARLRKLAGSRLTRESEILIVCDRSRSQRMNREEAIERLTELVAQAAVEPKVRKKKKPSRATKARRVEHKRRLTKKKEQRRWREE